MPKVEKLDRKGLRHVGPTTDDRYIKTTPNSGVLAQTTKQAAMSDLAAGPHTADLSFLFDSATDRIVLLQNAGAGNVDLHVEGQLHVHERSFFDRNITLGDGTPAIDFTLIFDGDLSDGRIKHNEGVARFEINQDFLLDPAGSVSKKLLLGEPTTFLQKSATGELRVSAAIQVWIDAPIMFATGDVDVTGEIIVAGNVDGRDVAADGTKLDGIATGAIANVVEDTTPQLGGDLDCLGFDLKFQNAKGIRDNSGNEHIMFRNVASAVNYVDFFNAATGGDPQFLAAGSDANIGLKITTKGSGVLALGKLGGDIELGDNSGVVKNFFGQHEEWTFGKSGKSLKEMWSTAFYLTTRQTYTPTNVTTRRTFDVATVTLAQLADAFGTFLGDMQTGGLIQ